MDRASTNPTNTWTGCVADRDQPYDVTGNTAQPFPANEYYENSTAYCDSNASNPLKPIIPLSYNWSALKTAVNAMQPTGGTNQAVGMAWHRAVEIARRNVTAYLYHRKSPA